MSLLIEIISGREGRMSRCTLITSIEAVLTSG
jgi:hypothetical protein